MTKFPITGGCGFLGSNIAAAVMREGQELALLDNLSRHGSAENLQWLRARGEFRFTHGDIRAADDVAEAIASFKPDAIFHLAGQVAMTTSLQRPRLDFEINALGSLNLLEAVRAHCPHAAIIYSSTNKVYGDLEHLRYEELSTRYTLSDFPCGLPETVGLDFHSPYGCSKGSADQGWIGWFCGQAVRQSGGDLTDFTIFGNGKQVRDVLYAEDIVGTKLHKRHIAPPRKRSTCFCGGFAQDSIDVGMGASGKQGRGCSAHGRMGSHTRIGRLSK